MPQQFRCLRAVPAYPRFIHERFERCLDLYLCPRQRKMRVRAAPAWHPLPGQLGDISNWPLLISVHVPVPPGGSGDRSALGHNLLLLKTSHPSPPCNAGPSLPQRS